MNRLVRSASILLGIVVFTLHVAPVSAQYGAAYPNLLPIVKQLQSYINGVADQGGTTNPQGITPLVSQLRQAQQALPPDVPRPVECFDELMGAWSLAQQGQRLRAHEESQRAVDCYANGAGAAARPAPPQPSGSGGCPDLERQAMRLAAQMDELAASTQNASFEFVHAMLEDFSANLRLIAHPIKSGLTAVNAVANGGLSIAEFGRDASPFGILFGDPAAADRIDRDVVALESSVEEYKRNKARFWGAYYDPANWVTGAALCRVSRLNVARFAKFKEAVPGLTSVARFILRMRSPFPRRLTNSPEHLARIAELAHDPIRGAIVAEGEAGAAFELEFGRRLSRSSPIDFVESQTRLDWDSMSPRSIGINGTAIDYYDSQVLSRLRTTTLAHIRKANLIMDFGYLNASHRAKIEEMLVSVAPEAMKYKREIKIVRDY